MTVTWEQDSCQGMGGHGIVMLVPSCRFVPVTVYGAFWGIMAPWRPSFMKPQFFVWPGRAIAEESSSSFRVGRAFREAMSAASFGGAG